MGVVVVWCGALSVTEAGSKEQMLARRAAELDAYAKLAAQVCGMKVSADRTVKDFVVKNTRVATHMNAFIKGAKVTQVRHLPDGSCEVEAELAIQDLVAGLDQAAGLYAKDWKGLFEALAKGDPKVLTATGFGLPKAAQEPNFFAKAAGAAVPRRKPLPPGWTNSRQLFAAGRVAEVDGYAQLAERIFGLHLDGDTTVREFFAENDIARSQMGANLKGIEVGPPVAHADGIVEREMTATLRQVIETIKTVTRRVKGKPGIDKKTTHIEENTVFTDITVIGEGPRDEEARKLLCAKRAAILDAYRKLAERIIGLKITRTSTMKDFVLSSDVIASNFDGFIKGARLVAVNYYEDGGCEVEMEVTLRELVEHCQRTVQKIYKGGKWTEKVFTNITENERERVIKVAGQGAPVTDLETFDMVVHVRERVIKTEFVVK